MQTVERAGKVINGKLHIHNRKSFDVEVTQFEGKEVDIIVRKKKKRRSHEQLRYHWGIVVPLVQQGLLDLGEENAISKEWVHTFLMTNFNFTETVIEKTGEVFRTPKSLSDNGETSTSDFMDFLARVQQFAIEYLNISIPLPNEQLEIVQP